MSTRYVLPLALLASASPPAAGERVRCSFDHGPARACVMTDSVDRGVHRMNFTAGRDRTTFIGRSNSGWWSGRLNGRAAMGYERNRGNIVFSTADLRTSFSWWYPANEHGTY